MGSACPRVALNWYTSMQNWLHQALRGYANPAKAFADIDGSISKYPSLALRQEQYINDRGAAASLVCLVGTIPVPYRGSSYNIPIRLWIPLSYPHEAPVVYVEPTPTMGVRSGSFVLENGRVYSPCQQSWDYSLPAHEKTIVFLLSQLRDIFSAEPPVYSTQPSMPAPMPAQPQANGLVYTQHPVIHSVSPALQMAQPPAVNFYAPPQMPHQIPQPMPQPSGAAISHHPVFSAVSSHSPNLNPNPSHSPNPSISSNPTPNFASLLQERIADNITMAKKELEEEAAIWLEKRDKLEYNNTAIITALSAADHEVQELRRMVAATKTQTEALRSFLDMDAGRIENLDPDVYGELLLYDGNKDSISHQIDSLNCEIQALDDTIYQLSQLLYPGNIDLGSFIKHVRSLARKVFLEKALLIKCESLTSGK